MWRIALLICLLAPCSSAYGKVKAKDARSAKIQKVEKNITSSSMKWALPFGVKPMPAKLSGKMSKQWGAPKSIAWRGYTSAKKSSQHMIIGEQKVDAKAAKALLKSPPKFIGKNALVSKVGAKKGFRMDIVKAGKGKYVSWVTHMGSDGFANYLGITHSNLKNARISGMKLGRAAVPSGNSKIAFKPTKKTNVAKKKSAAKAKPAAKPNSTKPAVQVAEPASDNTPMYVAIGCAVFALLMVGGAAMLTNPPPGKEKGSNPGDPEPAFSEHADDLMVA